MGLSEVTFRPPRIETDRVVLRGFEPTDAEAIFAYASDRETTQFMAWERSTRLSDAHAFLDLFVASHYENGELDYAVTLRGEEGRCVGSLGLYWRPKEHQVMELGYILHRDLWGKGLMPEACRALVRYGFATTRVERIFAPIFAPNTKSRRVAEKLGMHLDGVLRSDCHHHGRRWDVAIYSLLRGERISAA